jgi:peptidyl-prolyl cis-trans isomerase C
LCDANAMRRLALVGILFFVGACKGNSTAGPKGASNGEPALAQIDDMTITAADLKAILSRYANQPFVLARYSSLEKKKELLDSLIRYDVLAIEARKRGYERDPEVLRVAKDKMVRLFVQQEINDKIKPTDVPADQIAQYYKAHADDYVRPEMVRASEILVGERSKAAKVLAEVRAAPKSDMKAFRDLVAKYSEDIDSKQRGGDLTLFDRSTTQHPAPVVNAAFALKEVGDVSELVGTPKGFAILKLTERRPALSRTLDDAKVEIQRHLVDELRSKRRKELIEEARKSVKVEIFEDQLAKLDLADTTAAGSVVGREKSPGAHLSSGMDAGAVLGKQL